MMSRASSCLKDATESNESVQSSLRASLLSTEERRTAQEAQIDGMKTALSSLETSASEASQKAALDLQGKEVELCALKARIEEQVRPD